MRVPVKLNRKRFDLLLLQSSTNGKVPNEAELPLSDFTAFEEAISTIKIDTTWKTTTKDRHPLSDHLIGELAARINQPRILEIGASTCTTSLDLLRRLDGNFGAYYVTDRFFEIPIIKEGQSVYLYHPLAKRCIMCVSSRFIVYEDVSSSFFPLGWIAKRCLSRAPRFDSMKTEFASMVHPEMQRVLATDPKTLLKEYDVFDPWSEEPIDIVKVANVLNKEYFDDSRIRLAISNIVNALPTGGILVIVDNKEVESVSAFTKIGQGRVEALCELNGGSEIAPIVDKWGRRGT